jgi:hypothetical protein
MMGERDADVHGGGTSLYLQIKILPGQVHKGTQAVDFAIRVESQGKDLEVVHGLRAFPSAHGRPHKAIREGAR